MVCMSSVTGSGNVINVCYITWLVFLVYFKFEEATAFVVTESTLF